MLWEARWDPQVMIYIFHCFNPDDDAIMTGQLKNHDRPMFAIIAESTYNIAIPRHQSLQVNL